MRPEVGEDGSGPRAALARLGEQRDRFFERDRGKLVVILQTAALVTHLYIGAEGSVLCGDRLAGGGMDAERTREGEQHARLAERDRFGAHVRPERSPPGLAVVLFVVTELDVRAVTSALQVDQQAGLRIDAERLVAERRAFEQADRLRQVQLIRRRVVRQAGPNLVIPRLDVRAVASDTHRYRAPLLVNTERYR